VLKLLKLLCKHEEKENQVSSASRASPLRIYIYIHMYTYTYIYIYTYIYMYIYSRTHEPHKRTQPTHTPLTNSRYSRYSRYSTYSRTPTKAINLLYIYIYIYIYGREKRMVQCLGLTSTHAHTFLGDCLAMVRMASSSSLLSSASGCLFILAARCAVSCARRSAASWMFEGTYVYIYVCMCVCVCVCMCVCVHTQLFKQNFTHRKQN
jgi:hypothetical protein